MRRKKQELKQSWWHFCRRTYKNGRMTHKLNVQSENSKQEEETGWKNTSSKCENNLKSRKLLDYFRDGVNGLGVREQAVGDGCDDVKRALQNLPRVCTIQLSGSEHTFNAVPGQKWTLRDFASTQDENSVFKTHTFIKFWVKLTSVTSTLHLLTYTVKHTNAPISIFRSTKSSHFPFIKNRKYVVQVLW